MIGKRPVGKPKKTWMNAVKEDSYQIKNWRNWEVKAQDRDEWRSRIKKPALGCSAIDDNERRGYTKPKEPVKFW
jgi:hypothetical protein